jgi:hypothetical protein
MTTSLDQLLQRAGVAAVGGLPVQGFGADCVSSPLSQPGHVPQRAEVAAVGGLQHQGLGAVAVPNSLPQPG